MYPNMTLSRFLEYFELKSPEPTFYYKTPFPQEITSRVTYIKSDDNKAEVSKKYWESRKEWLIKKANGEEGSYPTRAARRICEKNGINWQG